MDYIPYSLLTLGDMARNVTKSKMSADPWFPPFLDSWRRQDTGGD
jgi:hypothetical protein